MYFPDNYDNMSDPIKLYHGTRLDAMDDIVESGVISALKGRQTGETRGINWFTTNGNKVSFGTGTVFSIEVPKSDFENGQFHFMNDVEVISRNDEIDIEQYNMRIEKIDGFSSKLLIKFFKKCGNDIWEFENKICDMNMFKSHTYDINFQLSIPSVRYILEQEFGKDVTKPYHDFTNESVDKVRQGIIQYEGYDMDEVDASDVNLDSFKVKNELQPDLWINGKINSEVRKHLLEIAHDFYDGLEIKWSRPLDVIVTGSLANYNWSEYSDIDLHLLLDFSEIYDDTELIEDYFKAKKDLWNEQHENLTIYGFPVEVYVEDTAEQAKSAGKFSLLKNKWISEPKDLSGAKINQDYIKEESAKIMTKIDELSESNENPKLIYNKCNRLFEYMKDLRKSGLDSPAMEMSSGNIIWKVLRREGYTDKLSDIMINAYDKINTIK